MNKRLKINIEGLVQGVGFRPFVYRTARKCGLQGFVLNSTAGVEMEVEGEEKSVYKFIDLIKEECPPLASITDITSVEMPVNNYSKFEIRKSSANEARRTLISPDVSICDDCLRELFDESKHINW